MFWGVEGGSVGVCGGGGCCLQVAVWAEGIEVRGVIPPTETLPRPP